MKRSVTRVGVVVTNSDRAGAPIHCLHLVRGILKSGRVPIFFCGERGEIFEELANAGVRCVLVPGLSSAISPLRDFLVLVKLRSAAKQHSLDLLHAHSSKAGLVTRVVGRSLRIPVIYTIHGWGFGSGRPMLQSFIVWLSERLCRPLTRHWIAVSEHDRNQGLNSLSIPKSKITTIYNGVPDINMRRVEQGGQDPKVLSVPFTILMVARDAPQKDYETLLSAFNAMVATVDVRLAVVGLGTDSDEFKSRAARLCARRYRNIEFLGVRDDIVAIVDRSDVFCLATHYEGLPLSVIEAMRSAKPVIASDVGGLRELVNEGENGYLVPPEDHRALARTLDYLAVNRGVSKELGRRGRQIFEDKFSVEKMVSETLAIYETLARV